MQIKHYPSKILIPAAIFIIGAFICYDYSFTAYYKYSLSSALDYYGFASPNQKHAIQNLFQRSSIIPQNKTLKQAFSARHTQEEVASDILTVLPEVQKKFMARQGTQERWEAQALEWMNHNKEKTLLDLQTLGFVDAVRPTPKNIDAFCILGATAPRMADRIEYMNSLLRAGVDAKAIILLAGERYVTKDIDGTEAQLTRIANKFNLQDWTKLTETHLIKYLYSTSTLYNKDIAVHIIDTPKRDLPRPTTETTIRELITWLQDHKEIHKIVFVSNQPYVKYQKAIIDRLFKDVDVNVTYEVVGSAVKNTEDLQPALEGLGSYILAATPLALSDMNVQITEEEAKQLYHKNPLIYNTISPILTK